MSPKWRIEIDFPGYRRIIQQFEKSDPQIVSRLQVAGQQIRKFCKDGCPPDDIRFGASIGSGLYKFRIPGHAKGKSGGYRLIYTIIWDKKLIVPIFVYSKSHKNNLTQKEFDNIIKELKNFIEKSS